MGQVGKGKTLVNVSLPNAWRDEIDRRAAVLRLTRATYTVMIVEKWWKDGQPPVSEPDRLMQIAAKAPALRPKK
jgi:hypothetical protein